MGVGSWACPVSAGVSWRLRKGLWPRPFISERYPREQRRKNVQRNRDKGKEGKPNEGELLGPCSPPGLWRTISAPQHCLPAPGPGRRVHWLLWLVGQGCAPGPKHSDSSRLVFVPGRLRRLPAGLLRPAASENREIPVQQRGQDCQATCYCEQGHTPQNGCETSLSPVPLTSSSLPVSALFCKKELFPHSPKFWDLLVMLRGHCWFSAFLGSFCKSLGVSVW